MQKYLKTLNLVTFDANLLRSTASRYSLPLIELAQLLNIFRAIIYRKPLRTSPSQANHLVATPEYQSRLAFAILKPFFDANSHYTS
jgi:hypothetical protein